jgi:thiol-activated cytolysin
MKTQIKNTIVTALALVGLTLASCSKNDDVAASNPANNLITTDLSTLKSVKFDKLADVKGESKKTGKFRTNANTGAIEDEFLTVVDKQFDLNPLSVVNVSNSDVIYPGSILRGSSFINGKYDPLVLKNKFNTVVMSGTLEGKGLTVANDKQRPILSEVRQSINDYLADSKIDYEKIPAAFSIEAQDITSEGSFDKFLKAHLDVNVLKGLVSVDFNYSTSSGSTSEKKYVLVKVNQRFFNLSIDPKYYGDWVDGPISATDCGEYEPLYIQSVDYGRVSYFLIQTDKGSAYAKEMVDFSVKVALKVVDVNVGGSYSNEFKSLFNNNSVKVVIVGGPSKLAQGISDFNGFVEFIKNPSTSELANTSVPISYKVRRLKDNTSVEVREIYKENILEYRPR